MSETFCLVVIRGLCEIFWYNGFYFQNYAIVMVYDITNV